MGEHVPGPMPEPDDGDDGEPEYVFDRRPLDRLRELQAEGVVSRDWTDLPAGFDEEKARAELKRREMVDALLEERVMVGDLMPPGSNPSTGSSRG